MNARRIETMVGAFVLLGLAAILFLALKAANLASFGQIDGYRVTAKFDNIGGLKPRAPVRSAGVTVGRVISIKLDPKSFQGVVTLEIDKDVLFPKDSSAKILTAGLLGDQYIGIEPGADEKFMEPNARIVQTQSAVVLENLIGQLLFDRTESAGSSASGASK